MVFARVGRGARLTLTCPVQFAEVRERDNGSEYVVRIDRVARVAPRPVGVRRPIVGPMLEWGAFSGRPVRTTGVAATRRDIIRDLIKSG